MVDANKLKEMYPDISDEVLKLNTDSPSEWARNVIKPLFHTSGQAGANHNQQHDELVTTVKKFLQGLGFLVNIPRKQQAFKGNYVTPVEGDKGYFDITAGHPEKGIVIFCEVKTGSGKLSPDQEKWYLAMGKCRGVTTVVLRPEDLERFESKVKELIDGK